MLDKFLSKINTASYQDSSINKKVDDYNKEVLEHKRKLLEEERQNFVANPAFSPTVYSNDKFSKFKKPGNFNRPNTYQTYDKKPTKEYVDDGSYFCSYSIGGTTLVCYKNKEKIELVLEGISHPDKNSYLAKKANYFLNDIVKKQKIYITETESGNYEIFLDSKKEQSINQMLITEGFHNSERYDPDSKTKKTSFEKKTSTSDAETDSPVKEKKNYAYGLFAKTHNTFEALFDKNKITVKLFQLDLDNLSKDDQKQCKSLINDFISKKSIILKIHKVEDDIHFVEVFNKEGDSLNSIISKKGFKSVEVIAENSDTIESEANNENEQCSENDWNWTSSEEKDSSSDKDVPDVTVLPAMFKKSSTSNPNSPFAKNKVEKSKESSQIEEEQSFGEELDVPDVTVLPAMFNKTSTSNPNSPFAKNKNLSVDNSTISVETKKKLAFGKR